MTAIDRLLSAADVAAWWGIEESIAAAWMREGRFGPVYGTRRVKRVTEQGVRDGTLRMQVSRAPVQTAQITDLPVRQRQRGQKGG